MKLAQHVKDPTKKKEKLEGMAGTDDRRRAESDGDQDRRIPVSSLMKLAQGSDKTERKKKNSRGGQGPTIDEEKNQIKRSSDCRTLNV